MKTARKESREISLTTLFLCLITIIIHKLLFSSSRLAPSYNSNRRNRRALVYTRTMKMCNNEPIQRINSHLSAILKNAREIKSFAQKI